MDEGNTNDYIRARIEALREVLVNGGINFAGSERFPYTFSADYARKDFSESSRAVIAAYDSDFSLRHGVPAYVDLVLGKAVLYLLSYHPNQVARAMVRMDVREAIIDAIVNYGKALALEERNELP